jgi:DNA-binding MarR family transcriptional regulator
VRREKIFGPAPSYVLKVHEKARIWAAAQAYNARNRRPGQHQGPLTWATLRVLRALLWHFHGADGGGRCFPSYEALAKAAKCARSTVALALKALEAAGLLTWVNRIARLRDQVIRISNAYRLRIPESENRTRPTEATFKNLKPAFKMPRFEAGDLPTMPFDGGLAAKPCDALGLPRRLDAT